MSLMELPWSFHASLISFAIWFASLNIYLITLWLDHPFASPLWLIGVVIGVVCQIFSYRMVRKHQAELIEKKQRETSTTSHEE